jgi:hypothetical protein
MVWSHVYGSLACSACSCARAAASAFARSSGGGEPDMVVAAVRWAAVPKVGLVFRLTWGGPSSSSAPRPATPCNHRILITALAGPDLQLIDDLPLCRDPRYCLPL